MTALRISCQVVSAIVGARDGLNLDGPLQYGAFVRWRLAGGDVSTLPPLNGPVAHDFDMPVQRWEYGDLWGWCTSDVQTRWAFAQGRPVRRPSPSNELRRCAREASVNVAAGQFKPLDLRYEALWPENDTLTWYAVGDLEGVAELLQHVTHLGKLHNHGCGKIAARLDGSPIWTVEEIDHDYSIHGPDDRLMRRMPRGYAEGRPGFGPIRAPAWHRSRYVDSVEADPA